LLKEQFPVVLNVIEVENPRSAPAHDLSELPLSLDEWQSSQIFAVQVQQIKSNK